MEGPQEVQPGERAKTMVALEVLLRLLRKAKDCFPDDDLETTVVFLTVAVASSSLHLRDPSVLNTLDSVLPDHLHKPTSGRAVADAAGLPRESVRRKLNTLVADGRLIREAGGYRTASGSLTHADNLAFARFVIRELDAASARIARYHPA